MYGRSRPASSLPACVMKPIPSENGIVFGNDCANVA